MRRQVIKDLKKCGLDKKFIIKIIVLGRTEQILNFYKIILKTPFKIIQVIATMINWLTEKIEDLTYFVMESIDEIKDICLVNKEDKTKTINTLKDYYKEKNTRKIETTDIKVEFKN